MKLAIKANALTAERVTAALTIIAGVLAIISWYQPWFTMHFTTGSSLVESPYQSAQDLYGRAAWLLLGVGIALTALGMLMVGWRRPLLTAVQTALTFGLLLTSYFLLGEMAVFTMLSGTNSAGVTLLPEWGFYLILLSLAVSVAASFRLWRQLRAART